jgi:hypothetical protein
MFSVPIPRTSFLDSRLRLRGRVSRLVPRGLSASDAQLDPVAHVGRPGTPPAPRDDERTDETHSS